MRNDFYVGVFNDTYLAHFGRLHQKWGVRNGPPYPLDREAVKKAYGHKGLQENHKRENEKYKKTGKTKQKTTGSGLLAEHDREWDEVWYNEDSGVTSFAGRRAQSAFEREVAYREERINDAVASGYDREDEETYYREKDEDRLYHNVKSGSLNPDYGAPGTTNNCSKNATLCELIKRGLSGFQAGRQTEGSLLSATEYWWDGAEFEDKDYGGASEYFDNLKPGSSGVLNVYGAGFGHSLHYMKTKNNYLRISDGQNGEVFDGLDNYFEHHPQFSKDIGVNIINLDNATPNWDHIAEDGVIRGNKLRNERTRKVVGKW